MKRLLLICGTALLLVPAAFAAKPSTPATALSVDCGVVCVMDTLDANGHYLVTLTGTGFSAHGSYAVCTDSSWVSFCAGMGTPVSSSGVLHASYAVGVPGLYCSRVMDVKRWVAVSPDACVTLVAPL